MKDYENRDQRKPAGRDGAVRTLAIDHFRESADVASTDPSRQPSDIFFLIWKVVI